MASETLSMAIWNRNGFVRTYVGYFEDIFKYRYFDVYRPINALLVNFLMYKDIDGTRYVVPNHIYQDVVEAPEELLCFKLLSA